MSEPEGLLQQLGVLLGAKLGYLRARLQLAGLEGKEAAAHYTFILALAVTALVVAIFGYFFFVIALVFLIASVVGGENAWIWVMFGAALLHFVAALVFALVARSKLARPIFSATLDELKKDQQWLKNPANPS